MFQPPVESPDALFKQSLSASQSGRADQGLELVRRAITLSPSVPEYWTQQGFCLRSLAQWQPALASFQRALLLQPHNAQLLFILGNTHQLMGQHELAIKAFEQSLAHRPDHAETIANLGSAYRDTRQLDRAIASYRRTLKLKPDARLAHDNLMLALLYHPGTTPQILFEEANHWNAQHARPLAPFITPHTNVIDPDRPLKIGYVSPDLANHPIGRFMLPLLTNHDRNRFQIICYSQIQKPDGMTAQLQSQTDIWRDISNQSDEQVAQQMRTDQIDILVDLALHSAKNRLLVFARKPAPVQVSYLGYAGGSALDTIDYRFTDRHLDPDPPDDHHYLQKAFQLTGTYWCYQHTGADLPVSPLPAITNHYVTLGCLNNFAKLTEPALETWAAILGDLQNARLLLHAPTGSPRDRLLEFFKARGIASNRLEFIGRVHPDDYFKIYHRIDIALDPFPYAGGTTTCDALWMGVPVVTLAGNTPVGHAGVSILNNAGLSEWIATDCAHYKNLVTDRAGDLQQLAEVRSSLRQKLQRSNLMDAVAYTKSIECAYRTIWQTWCQSR